MLIFNIHFGGKNMKKILPILIVTVLVLSGIGAVATSVNNSIKESKVIENNKSTTISFSAIPILQEKDGYLTVSFEGTNTESIRPGEPVLPICVQSFQLPAQASNIQVQCTFQELPLILSGQFMPPAWLAAIPSISVDRHPSSP